MHISIELVKLIFFFNIDPLIKRIKFVITYTKKGTNLLEFRFFFFFFFFLYCFQILSKNIYIIEYNIFFFNLFMFLGIIKCCKRLIFCS